MKLTAIAVLAAVTAAPAAADTVTFNSTPADGWFYGSGNNYAPANTAVLTTTNGNQLYLRFHKTFEVAPASVGNTYSFALGTTPLSFDWGIDINNGANISALLTLTNVGTGQTFSYDPYLSGGNAVGNGSTQNSFRFNWIPGLFDPNVDSTYSVDLTATDLNFGNSKSLSINAVFGAGAAVPEPSVWALLILGFGLVGAAMRRKTAVSVRYA